MAFPCAKQGKLIEEGAEAQEDMPVFWFKKTPLCPRCLKEGVEGKHDSFTVHKVEAEECVSGKFG